MYTVRAASFGGLFSTATHLWRGENGSTQGVVQDTCSVQLVRLKKVVQILKKKKTKPKPQGTTHESFNPNNHLKNKQRNRHIHNISLIPTKKYLKPKFTTFLKSIEMKNIVV